MTGPGPGIDFVDDGDHGGGDEDLPQRPSQAWRPRFEAFLHGRYGLPTVVVVLVLAFLVGRALLHERPAGAPPPSTSSTTDPPGSSIAVAQVPRRTGSDPARCPGLRCYTSTSAPASVRAAVRTVFPTARFTAVETIRLVDRPDGNPLWYREIDARVGTATLTVKVQAPADGDTADNGAKDDGADSVTYTDAVLEQWFVRVRVVDRSGTGDRFDQLVALAGDRRLLGL